MSFQPPPPPPPQWQPAAPAAAPLPPSAPAPVAAKRRTALLVVGLAAIVAGIVAVVIGIVAGSSRYEDGVEKLARAPAGCTTTLQFDKAGTYTLYLETKGTLRALSGDCGTAGSYRHEGALPTIDELTLVDEGGDAQTLDDATGKSYDAGGAKGSAIHSVKLSAGGTYRLTVSSSASDFAVAVGKDPKADGESVRNLGVGLGVLLVVPGIVLTILGLRRGRTPPPQPAWSPGYGTTPFPPAAPPPPPSWSPSPPESMPPPPPPPGWGTPPQG